MPAPTPQPPVTPPAPLLQQLKDAKRAYRQAVKAADVAQAQLDRAKTNLTEAEAAMAKANVGVANARDHLDSIYQAFKDEPDEAQSNL